MSEASSVTVDPAALTSGADHPYFAGLMEGEIRLQSCEGCGKHHWPAVFHCPDCGSWDHNWSPVSPEGTIYSWTRTWHSFGGLDAFNAPFVSVVVTLSQVPSVRLLGLLQGDEEGLAIGAPVSGAVHSVEFQGRTIPALSWSLV